MAYQRIKGLQRVTVELAACHIDVEHANPRLARRLGFAPRSVGFSDVASVQLQRTFTGARNAAHGRRVNLLLHDGTRVVLAEFTNPTAGITFAGAVAKLLEKPVADE